jgi:hypothetical protein
MEELFWDEWNNLSEYEYASSAAKYSADNLEKGYSGVKFQRTRKSH